MTHGGRRACSGRKLHDTVRIGCSVPRAIYDELARRERESGIYRTRIAATILCDELIGSMGSPSPLSSHAVSQQNRVASREYQPNTALLRDHPFGIVSDAPPPPIVSRAALEPGLTSPLADL